MLLGFQWREASSKDRMHTLQVGFKDGDFGYARNRKAAIGKPKVREFDRRPMVALPNSF